MSTGTPAPGETLSLDQAGRGIQIALVAVLIVVAISAFLFGAIPLIDIAQDWGELPVAVAILLPVVLDAAAVAAALAAIVRRVRGQRATLEMLLLALTVIVSVAAQITHAYWIGGQAWTPSTIITAAALGSAPIIVLLASHAAIRTLTPPRQKTAKRAARRPAPAPQKPAPAAQTSAPIKPAVAKPAAAPKPRLAPPVDLPERQSDEADLAYAIRLLDHGYGQRRAAELAGTTRSKIETRLKQKAVEVAADQPVAA